MGTKLTRAIQSLAIRFGISVSRSASPREFQAQLRRLEPSRMKGRFVRVGGAGDGAYVLPDILTQLGGVISPGVGDNSSFEKEFADREIPSLLIDGSVDGPPEPHKNFTFVRKWLGAQTGGEHIDLTEAVLQSGFEGDLLLQMDIEGGEYAAILASTEATLLRFRLMLIEVHRLAEMYHPVGLSVLQGFLDTLTLNHTVVHTHANSVAGKLRVGGHKIPDTLEVTLVRNDFFFPGEPLNEPKDLDEANGEKVLTRPRAKSVHS